MSAGIVEPGLMLFLVVEPDGSTWPAIARRCIDVEAPGAKAVYWIGDLT